MKSMLVIAFLCLTACSRESTTSAPASTPAKAKPGPTIVKQTEVLNEARPGETQGEAEMRALIRMDNLPCDRVSAMQQVDAGGQAGSVTCEVGQGKQEYVVDQRGKFSKR